MTTSLKSRQKKFALLLLSLLASLIFFAGITMLSACNKQAAPPEPPAPKRIIGLQSEKTYLRSNYFSRVEFFDYKRLELPLISLDEIKPDEIDEIKLDYEANTRVLVSEYELKDEGKQEGYYYYCLCIYLTANYIYNCQIDGITVVINGEDYLFSTDMNFGCANLYPDYFINPVSPLQMVSYSQIDNAAEISFMVSINSVIEITDISFMTSGIEVISLRTLAGEEINLPYTVNGKNLRICVTCSEPDDCLYYGNYVALKFNADGKSMTYTSAQSFNGVTCYGSALRG